MRPSSSRLFAATLLALWSLSGFASFLLALDPIPTSAPQNFPDWWFTRGVIRRTNTSTSSPAYPADYAVADDYAVLTQGQLKALATAAYDEIEAQFPGAASPAIRALVKSWFQLNSSGAFALNPVTHTRLPKFSTTNNAVVNLGQLKATARPFRDLLMPDDSAPPLGVPLPSDDYAAANIGMAKNLFHLDFTPNMVDSNGNGLPDWWEILYAGARGLNPDGMAAGGVLTYRQKFDSGADPTSPSSAGDGVSDLWKVKHGHGAMEVVSTQRDGIADSWKQQYGYDINDPAVAEADDDQDGLTTLEEFEANTDPTNADSDGDGVLDGADGWAGGVDQTEETKLSPPRLPKTKYAFVTLSRIPDSYEVLFVNKKGQAVVKDAASEVNDEDAYNHFYFWDVGATEGKHIPVPQPQAHDPYQGQEIPGNYPDYDPLGYGEWGPSGPVSGLSENGTVIGQLLKYKSQSWGSKSMALGWYWRSGSEAVSVLKDPLQDPPANSGGGSVYPFLISGPPEAEKVYAKRIEGLWLFANDNERHGYYFDRTLVRTTESIETWTIPSATGSTPYSAKLETEDFYGGSLKHLQFFGPIVDVSRDEGVPLKYVGITAINSDGTVIGEETAYQRYTVSDEWTTVSLADTRTWTSGLYDFDFGIDPENDWYTMVLSSPEPADAHQHYVKTDPITYLSGPSAVDNLEGTPTAISSAGQVLGVQKTANSSAPKTPMIWAKKTPTDPYVSCLLKAGDYVADGEIPSGGFLNSHLEIAAGQTSQSFLWRNYQYAPLADVFPDFIKYSKFSIKALNDEGTLTALVTSLKDPHTQEIGTLPPVEMMVDGNKDGNMDFTDKAIHDRDQTTKQKPYRFWLNNDHDIYHKVDGADYEYDDAGDGSKDSSYTSIYTERDLEDFTRLRITFKGITDLIKNTEYTVYLEWRSMDEAETLPASDGAPDINVYQERQPDIRPLYLEDETAAFNQRASDGGIHYDTWIGGTKPGQPMPLFGMRPELRTALSETNPTVNLLFCAKTAGRGRLILTIKKGTQMIGQYPPVYLELLDIKDMYERWTVDDEPSNLQRGGSVPGAAAQLTTRRPATGYTSPGHNRPFAYSANDLEEKKYIFYVHGWNMTPVEKEQFAETAYKRLFWQGYKGRFGVFEWPTTNSFNPEENMLDPLSDPTNYDRGEWSAWRSALPLRNLLTQMNQTYPGQVYVLAHSMGNVVTGEALRLQSQSGAGQIVNTYVASQAAVPAHCYDGTIAQGQPLWTNLQWTYDHPGVPGPAYNYGPATPNIYRNWLAFNGTAVGRRVSFRNLNDYALTPEVWQFNQISKPDWRDTPDQLWDYHYAGDPEQPPSATGFWKSREEDMDVTLQLGNRVDVKDRYEIMSFDAEPRSRALGGSPTVNGFVQVDLQSVWPADDSPAVLRRFGDYSAHKWHSAEFRSTNMRQKDYWKSLLGDDGFKIKSSTLP